jgi:hypothetical protein
LVEAGREGDLRHTEGRLAQHPIFAGVNRGSGTSLVTLHENWQVAYGFVLPIAQYSLSLCTRYTARYGVGNKNDYLTLEDSARMLGRPNSFLKSLMSEGKLGAKLAGGRWWISVRDHEELRRNLPREQGNVVRTFLSDTPSRKPPQKPKRIAGSNLRTVQTPTHASKDRGEELRQLDDRVRNLAAQIAAKLAYVVEGKAVWNKVRADSYKLNKSRRAALPNGVVALLAELQKTKQRYILLREVKRYKGVLRSSSEWDLWRAAKVKQVTPKKRAKKRVVAPSRKPKRAIGVTGYSGMNLSKKRYWFAEE